MGLQGRGEGRAEATEVTAREGVGRGLLLEGQVQFMLTAEWTKGERLGQQDRGRAGRCLREDGAGSLSPSGPKEPLGAWVGKSLHKTGAFQLVILVPVG